MSQPEPCDGARDKEVFLWPLCQSLALLHQKNRQSYHNRREEEGHLSIGTNSEISLVCILENELHLLHRCAPVGTLFHWLFLLCACVSSLLSPCPSLAESFRTILSPSCCTWRYSLHTEDEDFSFAFCRCRHVSSFSTVLLAASFSIHC